MSDVNGFDAGIADLATVQHGVITRSQALALGGTNAMIATRVSEGRWQRAHQGVFLLAGVPPSWLRTVSAARLACGKDALVARRTAAGLWGMLNQVGYPVEILLPKGRRVRRPGIVVATCADIARLDRGKAHGIACTSPTRTLIDLAGCVDEDLLEAALDDALRRGLTSNARLTSRLETLGVKGRRGAQGLLDMLLVRRGGRITRSELERRFFAALRRFGVPLPTIQFRVREMGRVLGVVDFAYPGARIAIELDSAEFHAGLRQQAADDKRENGLQIHGWRVLRFTWRDVMERPEEVCAQIATALGLRLP